MNKTCFDHKGVKLYFDVTTYLNGGRRRIDLLLSTGEPYATLTVNIPGLSLEPDEIIVKTSCVNADIVPGLLATGYFEDTQRRVPMGFTEASVWKVKLPELIMHFKDPGQAFEEAIVSGRLSVDEGAGNYAGHYMYMGTRGVPEGDDLFKHIDTREYLPSASVDNAQLQPGRVQDNEATKKGVSAGTARRSKMPSETPLQEFLDTHCQGLEYDFCTNSPCRHAGAGGCTHGKHPKNIAQANS